MLGNLFKKKEPLISNTETQTVLEEESSEELQAVIAYALHMYMTELHDHEKTVLTIKKVMRPYSPWSSKIYGLRRTPRY